jgi:hypothetical protein
VPDDGENDGEESDDEDGFIQVVRAGDEEAEE